MQFKVDFQQSEFNITAPEAPGVDEGFLEDIDLDSILGLACFKLRDAADKENLPLVASATLNFNVSAKKVDGIAHDSNTENPDLINLFIKFLNDVMSMREDEVEKTLAVYVNQPRTMVKCGCEEWGMVDTHVSDSTHLVSLVLAYMEKEVFNFEGLLCTIIVDMVSDGFYDHEQMLEVSNKVVDMRTFAESLQDYSHLIDDVEERQSLINDILTDNGFAGAFEQAIIMNVYRHHKEQDILAKEMSSASSGETNLVPVYLAVEFWAMIYILVGVNEGLIEPDEILDSHLDSWFAQPCKSYIAAHEAGSFGESGEKIVVMGLEWPKVETPLKLALGLMVQRDLSDQPGA